MGLVELFDNNNVELRHQLSKAVRNYRENKNLTQQEFSKISGLTRVFIAQLETDYRLEKQVRRDSVEKIAKFVENNDYLREHPI